MMLLAAIWFFLPAGLANAAPVFAALLPGLRNLNTPMDLGKSYHGKRIFGDHKTWRGLIAGIVMATLVIGLQKYLYVRTAWVPELSWFDYQSSAIWLLGPLFGLGVLLADAIESFFKRQRGIGPGKTWFPFDQTDYIVGGCLFSLPVVQLSLERYIWVLVTWFGLHLLSVYIGHRLGIREKPI
jgi:CDP-2,3-bis-(O-geranylgeranyl)-sn-glycerol synthase